jgi:hypothetical protein
MGLRKAERPMSEALLLAISPQTMESFLVLALGFAVAGMSANGYRLFGEHFPSFRLWKSAQWGSALSHPSADAFRPVYYHAQHRARQPHRASPLQIRHDATVIAGLWSLMSGTAVVMPLQALLSV